MVPKLQRITSTRVIGYLPQTRKNKLLPKHQPSRSSRPISDDRRNALPRHLDMIGVNVGRADLPINTSVPGKFPSVPPNPVRLNPVPLGHYRSRPKEKPPKKY